MMRFLLANNSFWKPFIHFASRYPWLTLAIICIIIFLAWVLVHAIRTRM